MNQTTSTLNRIYRKIKTNMNTLTAAAKNVLSPISERTVIARDFVNPWSSKEINSNPNDKVTHIHIDKRRNKIQ